MSPSPASRIAHAAVALFAAAGVLLHYAVVLGHSGEVAVRTLRFFSYFTILTNMLVAASALGIALGRGRWAEMAMRPAWRTAVTLDILVVALIYHLLLRNVTLPGAIGWTANVLVHQLSPAAWILSWVAFPPHGSGESGAIERTAPLRWLLYPLGFGAWTLVHGAIGGWYPYPFMDVARFGYPAVLRNMAMIALLFAALGYGLRWIDGRLGRRRPLP